MLYSQKSNECGPLGCACWQLVPKILQLTCLWIWTFLSSFKACVYNYPTIFLLLNKAKLILYSKCLWICAISIFLKYVIWECIIAINHDPNKKSVPICLPNCMLLCFSLTHHCFKNTKYYVSGKSSCSIILKTR